jgi:hypothetical protein
VSSEFSLAFPLFKEKLQEFTTSSSFESKTKEYKRMLEQIRSTLPQQRKLYLHKSPEFLQTVEKSLQAMERIVSLHDELDQIFTMDEEELGVFCGYDLKKVENVISKGLQEVANLLYEFETVSRQGIKIIEVLEDPFLSQGS